MADVFDVAQKAQQGIQSATTSGIEQGVSLAKMANEQEKHKQAVAAQKEELEQKKFTNMSGRLTTLMRSSPQIAKTLYPKFEEAMNAQGTPVDPGFKDALSDPAFKIRMQKALNAIQENASPQARTEALESLSDMGMLDEGLKMIESAQKRKVDMSMQDKQLQNQAAMKGKDIEREDAKLANQDAQELSTRLGKDALPDAVSALADIESAIKEANGGKGIYDEESKKGFEGLTGAAAIKILGYGIGEKSLTPAQQKMKAHIARFRNLDLKKLSGGAVSDSEADRFKEAFGEGVERTPEQVKEGLRILAKALNSSVKNIEGGYSPQAKELYQKRGGEVTSARIPQEKPAQGVPQALNPDADQVALKKFDPAKIEAFKKIRGL